MIPPHPLRFLPALAIVATLSACNVPAPKPMPSPTPTPAITPPEQIRVAPAPESDHRVNDWRNAPLTPGDWSYRVDGDATRAIFRRSDRNETAFVFHCSLSTRQVTLMQAGAPGESASMQIKTDEGTRLLSGTAITGAAPANAVRLGANDPLLDQIAFTRGKFRVESTGLDTLNLPPWPEISRVIEDCRS